MMECDVQWIVNSLGELGVKIGSQCFFLYKGESLEYGLKGYSVKDGVCLHSNGTPMRYRIVGKREFGEVCHPVGCMEVVGGRIYDRTPNPYTKELKYTPGLSFGKPEDSEWQLLMAPPATVPADETDETDGVL